jgi:SAM-dependent methyltransferase
MMPEREPIICPVCEAETVEHFAEIFQVPVFCNVLWTTRDEAVNVPRADLRLGFCRTCGHIHNSAFDPSLIEYTPAYENALDFSPRFRQYVDELSDHLLEKYHLYEKTIIEIGCGKGDFLRMLCRKGRSKGIGFDPSYELGLSAEGEADITIIQDLYTERDAHHEADFICCRHVLEHVQHPTGFMSLVRRTLGERRDSAVFFEVPNVRSILQDGAVWDLIYEHCSYFSSTSLAYLFRRCGFAVCDASEAFGGQYLCIEALPGKVEGRSHSGASELTKMTREIQAFARGHERKIEAWRLAIEEIGQSEQRAVIWGAGSKGVTLSNVLNAQEYVEHVVDINPRKQGMYVSGTGQQIMPPAFLQSYRPDVIILTNPIYEDEIRAHTRSLGLAPTFVTA